jgi:hypothetical protein
MLDAALIFFQEELNNYIKVKTGGQREGVVQFPEIQPPKDISMQSNAITALLINLEEERLFRSGAVQSNRLANGGNGREAQNLCLNFHLLLIANFKDYIHSLKVLSLTLKFFRSYRTFTQQRFPGLSADIQQLSTELVNLTFMEQGELWRSLEMPCSPSVLYKVKMLIFQDSEIDDVETGDELRAIETVTSQI